MLATSLHTEHAPRQGLIALEDVRTLPELFAERVTRTPAAAAYSHYDEETHQWRVTTWGEMAHAVARWQVALMHECFMQGDRVALMLRNSRAWVAFEQAALSQGLVVVPLYPNDRPANAAYILRDSGARLVVVEDVAAWQPLAAELGDAPDLVRVIVMKSAYSDDARVRTAENYLPVSAPDMLPPLDCAPQALATLVYTSGTTGKPKGVMLSHRNILWNAAASLQRVPAYPEDIFLSFLPLSHMLERTVGYYAPMMAGARVAHCRAVQYLSEDMQQVQPTFLIAVPRIFERVYGRVREQINAQSAFKQSLFNHAVEVGWSRFEHLQHRGPWHINHLQWPLLDRLVGAKLREKLGGRLRVAVCGGAPIGPAVAKLFIGLGINLIQGYGLTETSPVLAANSTDSNDPASIGPPLVNVEVKLADDGELLVKSPGVMLGYWQCPEATQAVLDPQGWLRTGDTARLDGGRLYITGRLKEIIVMANGEKVPPADMELAILLDPLFEQVIVLGEGKPFLTVLAVVQQASWTTLAATWNLDPTADAALADERVTHAALERIAAQTRAFPGYAQIRRVLLLKEPWTIDNGLLTPTLKLKRNVLIERFSAQIEALYAGH